MGKKGGIQDLVEFLDSDSVSQELDKEFYTFAEIEVALKKLFFYHEETQNHKSIRLSVGGWDIEVLRWLMKKYNSENNTNLNLNQYISKVVIKAHIRKAGKDYGHS